MSKVKDISAKTMTGGGLTPDEALYLVQVLGEARETLIYVQKNSLYFKESTGKVASIAERHAGTVVGIAANIQLKTRRIIDMVGEE